MSTYHLCLPIKKYSNKLHSDSIVRNKNLAEDEPTYDLHSREKLLEASFGVFKNKEYKVTYCTPENSKPSPPILAKQKSILKNKSQSNKDLLANWWQFMNNISLKAIIFGVYLQLTLHKGYSELKNL